MKKSNKHGERLIFVGGSPRSGTTLIQFILGVHPEIYAGPEFDNIPHIINLYKRLNRSYDIKRINTFTTKEKIKETISSLISGLLLPVADENNKTYISEKTPANILYFTELFELFPKAKFIFVIRDPRAVLYSNKKVYARAKKIGKDINRGECLIRDIQEVHSHINSGFEFSKNNPNNVLIIQYEKLIKQKEKSIKNLCNFLQIEFDEKMLNLEKIEKNDFIEVVKLDQGIYSGNNNPLKRPIDDKSLNKWRNGLTYWEIILIDYYLKRKSIYSKSKYDSIHSLNMVKVALSIILSKNIIAVGNLIFRNLFYRINTTD